jgi:hypothetical protein
MRTVFTAFLLALLSNLVFAQTPELATPPGHEVSLEVSHYRYAEPGATSISIHGPKLAGEYRGTLSLGERGRWFARAGVRGVVGKAAYDGWCMPFLIKPNRSSPNGYELDLGDPSPCSETGDRDWYVETSAVVGKDFVGDAWAWSPFGGLGFRHLSNGTSGIPGFRTDEYLYLPVGVTARTKAGRGTLGFTLEYDRLIRGWQKTRDSRMGNGDVPATSTAPQFTINGFSDISFDQHGGWALRASVKYQLARRWSVEPSLVYWNVDSSPDNYETVTFTVNNVTAREQWGAYEPHNTTREFGVKVGVRF